MSSAQNATHRPVLLQVGAVELGRRDAVSVDALEVID